jgi:hypothetical protein
MEIRYSSIAHAAIDAGDQIKMLCAENLVEKKGKLYAIRRRITLTRSIMKAMPSNGAPVPALAGAFRKAMKVSTSTFSALRRLHARGGGSAAQEGLWSRPGQRLF